MVQRLLRRSQAPRSDPHGWVAWHRLQFLCDTWLEQRPFVLNPLDALTYTDSPDKPQATVVGIIDCQRNVRLLVELRFELRYFGDTLRVRCHSFLYIGWLGGEHLLLKYHNHHEDRDEYHHRIYDPSTGRQICYERLERWQFPTLAETLDELEILAEGA